MYYDSQHAVCTGRRRQKDREDEPASKAMAAARSSVGNCAAARASRSSFFVWVDQVERVTLIGSRWHGQTHSQRAQSPLLLDAERSLVEYSYRSIYS